MLFLSNASLSNDLLEARASAIAMASSSPIRFHPVLSRLPVPWNSVTVSRLQRQGLLSLAPAHPRHECIDEMAWVKERFRSHWSPLGFSTTHKELRAVTSNSSTNPFFLPTFVKYRPGGSKRRQTLTAFHTTTALAEGEQASTNWPKKDSASFLCASVPDPEP
jgi:hypothetical protein